MKFIKDGKGNFYTKCDYSGISISRVYQILKTGTNERFGCFMDPACAVAFYTNKNKENKLEANKLAEYLTSIAIDLRLSPSQTLIEAPPLDAVNPDLSYQKKYPWMICDELSVSCSFLKQRQDEANKEKKGDVGVLQLSKSVLPSNSEKNIYVYTIDPEATEAVCSIPYACPKQDGFILPTFAKEYFCIFTTYKSKDVFLVGCSSEKDSEGKELVFNNHVKTLFTTNVKASLYGTAWIISKRLLGQPVDEVDENALTLFADQKKNRKPNNFKTLQSESIVNKFFAAKGIIKEPKVKTPPNEKNSETSPPPQPKATDKNNNKRQRTE